MVVLHHTDLDRTLWGPASTAGRSRATDVAIYIQLGLVALLGVTCTLDYDKPEAVRLGATAATLLVYFRSTALFIRLVLFVSALVLYGDVLVPVKRLAGAREVLPLPTIKLLLHCIWVWNIVRILCAIFRSGVLSSEKGVLSPRTMQGGLFLFPLYVDTEDVVAADAREMVHPMAAEPVAGAETFNPQRMATLIRTANAGRLSTVGETTEIDADVLNSMPKWAQAVVQTGCFNAESARGLKASPSNKLKRRLELQNETEYEQPCKRQSVRNTTDDMSSMHDEGGELQNCLDELNAEHDVEVEVEDKAEPPALPTQAEITAYSVEKYAELLVKLVDVAMYRQQQEDFELGDQDVFSSDEVKLLLQSLKAMEKNDWINKLEPELLISLMSAFDTQVQLGLTLDVLAAMMPSNEEKRSHLY
ncbi:hypothetical protein KRP22_010488 [Phytophthora ramorum]|nr:hypothetical protein KRP22_5642 [Phytophthora ramorum]